MGSRSRKILQLCKSTVDSRILTKLENVVFPEDNSGNEPEIVVFSTTAEDDVKNLPVNTQETFAITEDDLNFSNESGVIVTLVSEKDDVNHFNTEQDTSVVPVTETSMEIQNDIGMVIIPACKEGDFNELLAPVDPVTEEDLIIQFQNEPGTIVIPFDTNEDFSFQNERETPVNEEININIHDKRETFTIPAPAPTENKKQVKRKRVADPGKWKKNESKTLRMKGQAYLGYSAEKGSIKQNKPRSSRNLKAGCNNNKFCIMSSKRNCSSFTEEKRKELFNLFWNMSWEQKKIYVLGLVLYLPKKRSYVQGPSRRTGSFIYNLRLDNERLQVCKKMFLTTFDVKEKMVHNWILGNQNHGFAKSMETENQEKTEKRNNTSFNLKCKAKTDFLKRFLDRMPKMESHYCRKDTNKLYFEHPFKTKTEIYEIYKTMCENENQSPVSTCSFNKIFDELNLSIYQPRKDQCDLCCQ